MSIESNLNESITAGVKAIVEAKVLEAFASDDFMAAAVQAALTQKVDTGTRKEMTLLNRLLQTTIEEKTRQVVIEEVANRAPAIRAEVRAALDKSIGVITDSLVDGFVASAAGRYPSIEVNFRGRD